MRTRTHTRSRSVAGSLVATVAAVLGSLVAAANVAAQDVQPAAPVWLGTVTIPRPVLADGHELAAGRYRIRLTAEVASKPVVGQPSDLERWVEFVQGSTVKGRALAPVVPSDQVQAVARERPPAPGHVRVQHLRPQDRYVRLWFNDHGSQILVYLPYAPASRP